MSFRSKARQNKLEPNHDDDDVAASRDVDVDAGGPPDAVVDESLVSVPSAALRPSTHAARNPAQKNICTGLRMVPGRAARTACMAPLRSWPPNARSTQTATVPVRPLPPKQWIRTRRPERYRSECNKKKKKNRVIGARRIKTKRSKPAGQLGVTQRTHDPRDVLDKSLL